MVPGLCNGIKLQEAGCGDPQVGRGVEAVVGGWSQEALEAGAQRRLEDILEGGGSRCLG